MSDFEISDRLLTSECVSIVQDCAADLAIDFAEMAGSDRDELDDAIAQTIDGHEWVIYHHKALRVCVDCDVDEGEAFLEDVGLPENPTLGSIASVIVYGEMRARCAAYLEEAIERAEGEA